MLFRRPQDLAALFRDGRARIGWSQTDLAERVGVSRQWISLVENGKTSVEFDLAIDALHVLGYRLHVESPDQATPNTDRRSSWRVETPAHRPNAGRTPLTRHGESLGTQRTRRRQKRSKHTKGRRD